MFSLALLPADHPAQVGSWATPAHASPPRDVPGRPLAWRPDRSFSHPGKVRTEHSGAEQPQEGLLVPRVARARAPCRWLPRSVRPRPGTKPNAVLVTGQPPSGHAPGDSVRWSRGVPSGAYALSTPPQAATTRARSSTDTTGGAGRAPHGERMEPALGTLRPRGEREGPGAGERASRPTTGSRGTHPPAPRLRPGPASAR